MGNVSDKVRVMKVIKVSIGQWSRRRSEASAFAGPSAGRIGRASRRGQLLGRCRSGLGERFSGTPNSLRRATPRRTRVLPGTGGWHRFGPAGSAQGVDFPHIEKMSELYTRGNARSKIEKRETGIHSKYRGFRSLRHFSWFPQIFHMVFHAQTTWFPWVTQKQGKIFFRGENGVAMRGTKYGCLAAR